MVQVTHLTKAASDFVAATGVVNGTNITGTIGSNGISLSVAPGGGGADGYNIIAAGGSTAASTGTYVFSNSNGISFSLNGSTITASHNALTSQSNQAITAGNGSFAFQTLSFSNANGISFSTSAGSAIIASHNGLTTAAQSNHSHNFATTTTNGSLIVVGTTNSAGATIAVPSFLTTAMLSNAATISNIRVSGGTTSNLLSAVTFSDSNGVSFGLNASTLTATVRTNYASSDHSHGNPTLALTNISGTTASNSAGLTLSLSVAAPGAGGGIALANSQTTYTSGTAHLVVAGGAMTIASTTGQSFNFSIPQTSSFVAVGALTLSTNGSTISISGNSVSAVPIYFSAGTTSNSISNIIFSNSNGVSFGLNGSTITASHNGLTSQSNQAFSADASSTFQTLVFQDSNGFSFSNNAGSLRVTHGLQFTSNTSAITSNALHTTSPRINVSGGTTSNNLSAITFSNSNGISFGLNASTITASHNGLTTAALSNHSHNFATTTTNGALIVVGTTNSDGATIGVPAFLTTAQAPGAYLTTAAQSNQVVNSLNGSTGVMSVTVASSLSMSTNGSTISFGLASNITTALQSAGAYLTTAMLSNAVTLSNIRISGGTTSNLLSALTFSDSNGISFGLNASTMTATVRTNYASSDHSHGNPTLALTNLSGTTASNSAGLTLSLSVAAPGAGGGIALANSQTTYTSGTAHMIVAGGAMTIASTTGQSFNFSVPATSSLVGVGGITISSNGSTVSISNVGASPNFSAGTTSSNIGSVVFSNSNGVSFGLNGSTVTASHNGLTTAAQSNHSHNLATTTTNGSLIVVATTNSLGATFAVPPFLTTAQAPGAYLTTAAQSNQVVNSLNGSTGVMSVTVASSLSMSTAGSTISFGLASNITTALQSAGAYLTTARASNDALGFNTAQSNVTWTANSSGLSLDARGYAGTGTTFNGANISGSITQNSNGVQLSMSVAAPGGGTPLTISRYNEFKESPLVAGAIGNGTLHIQPWLIPNLQMDRVVLHNQFSNATNSSGSFTLSQWVGIYTRTVSTLSLLSSVSGSTNFTGSGTVGSYSLYGGIRAMTLGLTGTLTEGMYWIGVIHRSTSGGANQTVSQMLNSNVNSTYSGILGLASNATNQLSLGFGAYTASTSSMPNSIGFTQINGNSSVFLRPPSVYFVSDTI